MQQCFTASPLDVHFSPRDLVTSLTTLVQPERLTVGFYSPQSSPSPSMTPQCTTLSSLTVLKFHGPSEYLEEFVARIDAPALRNQN